jgi:AraC-like DNA-binding protein
MDSLSDLIPPIRVTNATYARLNVTAPWGIHFRAFHHAKFGIVLQGRCCLKLAGSHDYIELRCGDYYMLPRGNAFSLRDDPSSTTQSFGEILQVSPGPVIDYGGGGAATVIVGGRFVFDKRGEPPVLDLLPDVVHFNLQRAQVPNLQATLQLLASETATPTLGSQLVVNRIADIFFVQTLRAYIETNRASSAQWFRAAADSQIGQALRLMHERREQPWTIEALATQVGLSRSAFAQRFKAHLGEAPLEYLSRLRIETAARMLRETDANIASIAQRTGYESEAAFSRAFKRKQGVAPGKYRRGEKVPDSGASHES